MKEDSHDAENIEEAKEIKAKLKNREGTLLKAFTLESTIYRKLTIGIYD